MLLCATLAGAEDFVEIRALGGCTKTSSTACYPSRAGPQNMVTVRSLAIHRLRSTEDGRSHEVHRKSAAWNTKCLEGLLRYTEGWYHLARLHSGHGYRLPAPMKPRKIALNEP